MSKLICPAATIRESLSSPSGKKNLLASSGKSAASIGASRLLQEGRFATVTDVGSGMRWAYWVAARLLAPTNNPGAHGEVVWSWHPGADAKVVTTLCVARATGARTPVPGEIAYKP
jgi:hypothetical protein